MRLFVLVFFPTNIANGAGPPALCPMSKVGHGVLGAAAETFRLGRNLWILDFRFRHSQQLLLLTMNAYP